MLETLLLAKKTAYEHGGGPIALPEGEAFGRGLVKGLACQKVRGLLRQAAHASRRDEDQGVDATKIQARSVLAHASGLPVATCSSMTQLPAWRLGLEQVKEANQKLKQANEELQKKLCEAVD